MDVSLVKRLSDLEGVDPRITLAIIGAESAGHASAMRYEPHYKWTYKPHVFAASNNITEETELLSQKISWGLMQVMGGVAREHGHTSMLSELIYPEIGIRMGAAHLRKRCLKYPILGDVFAAYNAGTPKKQAGFYAPKSTHLYVQKTMQLYETIKLHIVF